MDTNWKRAPQIKRGRHVMYRQSDFRYDGRRVRSRSSSWGDLAGSGIPPQDDPMRNSDIFELEWRASYSGRQGQAGAIKYYREPVNPELAKRNVASGWAGASYTDNGRLLPAWYIWKNGRPVPDTPENRGH